MSTAAKRVAISLAPGERDVLQQLAHETGEPVATTAGRLIRAALADHGARLDTPPARRAGPPRPRGAKRRPAPTAPGDPIQALRTRYPTELRHLPADPDTFVTEQLAALAAWREQLDNQPPNDPRHELAFGHALRDAAGWLQTRARRGL